MLNTLPPPSNNPLYCTTTRENTCLICPIYKVVWHIVDCLRVFVEGEPSTIGVFVYCLAPGCIKGAGPVCLELVWVLLYEPMWPLYANPSSGNSGPKCVSQISLTCSWSLQWLSGNPLLGTSTAYSITGFTSEGKSHPFSVLLSTFDFLSFTQHRSVESARLILLPVLMKCLSEVWVHAALALRAFVPSVLAFSSK